MLTKEVKPIIEKIVKDINDEAGEEVVIYDDSDDFADIFEVKIYPFFKETKNGISTKHLSKLKNRLSATYAENITAMCPIIVAHSGEQWLIVNFDANLPLC